MKFSNIKDNTGRTLNQNNLNELGQLIVGVLAERGFKTGYKVDDKGKLKIGLHGKSFVIDTEMHGYNSKLNPFRGKPSKTSLPTWEQRVEYNNTINDIMDKLNLNATIKNSVFIIRDKNGRKDEAYWQNNQPEFMQHNISRGFAVVKGTF